MSKQYSIAEARDNFPRVVHEAETGEAVELTRRGKPVARLTTVSAARKPIDRSALEALTKDMGRQTESAGEFIRSVRDGDRY